MAETKGHKKLRPLGNLELYHYFRSKLGLYSGVAHTAQYVISSKNLEELGGLQAVIFAALKTVVYGQPIMGVSVVPETSHAASWIRLDTINLQEVTQFLMIPGGVQFIEDEHQKPIELIEELPLWRVVVAEHRPDCVGYTESSRIDLATKDTTFEVGFFYCHAIGDGLSGAAFHLEFLDALNALGPKATSSKHPLESIIEVPKLELIPNLENAALFPLSILFILWEIIKAFIIGDKDSKRWTGPPVKFSQEAPPKTRLSSITLDTTTCDKISKLCRQNKVTFTPLLTVLIARHLSNAYPTKSRFLATVPIQLRRFTGAGIRQMVDHVSSVTVHCSRKAERGYVSCKSAGWEDIQACRTVLDRAAKSPANQITIMLKYVTNFEKFFLSMLGKTRSNSFEVSNVGLVDGGLVSPGIAKIKRLLFSQSANAVGAPYVFSVVSLKGGDMVVALTWEEGILEEAKAIQVLEALEDDLISLANGL